MKFRLSFFCFLGAFPAFRTRYFVMFCRRAKTLQNELKQMLQSGLGWQDWGLREPQPP
jgi:hypothetical protein